MNFYQHQDRARRRTFWLVVVFVLAVVAIVVALNLVAYLAVNASQSPPLTPVAWLRQPWPTWIAGGVVGVIGFGTLRTSLRLRGGGPALADMLGARLVDVATQDIAERRLRNVVEEMSIASGTPVPALYVLDDEAGINAFVAGTRPSETVMVVTRGALEAFDRQELQGVVAHEYSHIFNNDMALNLRLMGVIAGLVLIGQFGRVLLRSGTHGRNRNAGQLALAGLAVLAIGYLGLFCAALIKAAVSRQREFLADASAAQFTRDNEGIASALWKIGQSSAGAVLENGHAEDISHFCFGEPVTHAFTTLLATHPPIAARIRAVNPGFVPGAAARRAVRGGRAGVADPAIAAQAPRVAAASAAGSTAVAGVLDGALDGAAVAASVGTLDARKLAFGSATLAALPPALQASLHRPDSAARVLFALLFNAAAPGARDAVSALAADFAGGGTCDLAALAAELAALPAGARLPVAQLALASLRELERPARVRLVSTVKSIIVADRQYTVFEFALMCLLRDHLGDEAARRPPTRVFSFADVTAELHVLLSALALNGGADEVAAAAAFRRAWAPFALGHRALMPRTECGMSALGRALQRLAQLSPLLKQNVVRACADCVIDDGQVSVPEGELLQAVALSLDCPLPPLV